MTSLHINLSGDKPVYLQIEEYIRRMIMLGGLAGGARLPAVRDLAGELGINVNTVARAYLGLVREGLLVSHRGGGTTVALEAGERIAAHRFERLGGLADDFLALATGLGFTPGEVERSITLAVERWRAGSSPKPRALPVESPEGTVTFSGSHDLTLEVLFRRLAGINPPVTVRAQYVGSLEGIVALLRGEAEVAGCHLLDQESGEYNVSFVRRLLSGQPVVLVSMARRVQGMYLAKGNPKGVRGIGDLARHDVSMANRQRGSGTRVLLDYLLRKAGIDPLEVEGYEWEYGTHLDVAAAVAQGKADAGLGIQAAALTYGLEFIPLVEEPYDLLISAKAFQRDEVQKLLSTMKSPSFRQLVRAMGGYDVQTMGEEKVIA